jgi:quercetin dioxygenase-like cupin family protein
MDQHAKPAVALLFGASTIIAALLAGPALGTPGSGGFQPTPIFVGTFDDLDVRAEKTGKWDITIRAKGQTDLRVTRVSFPAGASSGWHSHPGPNLLTATQGTVVEYEGSNPLCVGTTYHQGDTFGDNGGRTIHLVRNESGAPAEVMATAFYPHGVTPLTDSRPAKPTNCPAGVE